MSDLASNTEYLKQRLEELAITDTLNTFTRHWVVESSSLVEGKTVIDKKTHTREYRFFDADEHGNIVIHYFNQHGQPYTFKTDDIKWPKEFVRKRLRVPTDDRKYSQEKGSGIHPFFTPGIIKKYQLATNPAPAPDKKEKKPKPKKNAPPVEDGTIETLFLVEGEFKAFKGDMHGLDIIGIPGIFGLYSADVKGKLHEDIEAVIVACKVKKLVLLLDADTVTIHWEADKDLSKRPSNFYGSVKAFRESLQLLLDMDNAKCPLDLVYFMHIKEKYLPDAKGLDDLFCKYTSVTDEIYSDLFSFNFAHKFFAGRLINDLNKDVQGWLYSYLGLTDEQQFYKTYKDFIGPREFKFKRRKYIYDPEGKEVKFMKHEDAEKFMRIGPDWVKLVPFLNKHGETEEDIQPWKISEIERDYKKKYPTFIDDIPKYDGFCNEPAWDETYKPTHNNLFNICRPLSWKPDGGSIEHTLKFLKHIFQGEGSVELNEHGQWVQDHQKMGDQFSVALDYFSLQYRVPKHMLPVPILVSPEFGTGKSTVLKWLQQIYGTNMCVLGNEQFQMKFNSHYITKYIIGVDESFLEVDKKKEKERLKQMVTADSAFIEFKGMNLKKINYYGKIIFCSNDADRVMKIEAGENRWFIVRVPIIPRIELTGQQLQERGYTSYRGATINPEQKYQVPNADPDLEKKMKAEIPAWLHYLKNRKIFHPRVDRLWFDPEWFITDQFRVIVETTKNRIDRVFEDWLREQFMLYRLPTLRYTQEHLKNVFNDPKNSKYKIDTIDLKNYLQDKLGMRLENPQRLSIPTGYDLTDDPGLPPKIRYLHTLGRPYVFRHADWLTTAQIESWGTAIGDDELVKEENMREADRINAQSVAALEKLREEKQKTPTIGAEGYPIDWKD